MKLTKWVEQVQDRHTWKDIVEKAKTLSCSVIEEEEVEVGAGLVKNDKY